MNDQALQSALQAVQWHSLSKDGPVTGCIAPTCELRDAAMAALKQLLGTTISSTNRETSYPRSLFPEVGDAERARMTTLLKDHGITIHPSLKRAELFATSDPAFQTAKAAREAAEKEAELAAQRALEATKANARNTCLAQGIAWYNTPSNRCGLYLHGQPDSDLQQQAARILTIAAYLPGAEAALADPTVVREGPTTMGKIGKTIEKFTHLGINTTHGSDGVFVEFSNPDASRHIKAALEAAEIAVHPGRMAAQQVALKSLPSTAISAAR